MNYGFATEDLAAGTAAALVYAVYRSRDPRRMKVTPEWWGYIERCVKGAAKRADSLPRFLETLKPRLGCDTLNPAVMGRTVHGWVVAEPPRDFLTEALAAVDERAVLRQLYRETAWVVLLVRDRLERERPLEATTIASALLGPLETPVTGDDEGGSA